MWLSKGGEHMGTRSDESPVSRRRFLKGTAGFLGASLLAACGAGAGGGTTGGGNASAPTSAAPAAATSAPAQGGQAQVTIDLWDQQTGIAADATKKIITDFEAKNPGIKINRTY